MVSDQEIAKGVEILLSQKSFNSLPDVVHQLSENLGFDLSHKIHFIRDHIYFLLRSSSQPQPPQLPLQPPPLHQQQQFHHHFTQQTQLPQRQHHVEQQQFHPHPLFALPQQHQVGHLGHVQRQRHPVELNFGNSVVVGGQQLVPEVKSESRDIGVVGKSNEKAKKG